MKDRFSGILIDDGLGFGRAANRYKKRRELLQQAYKHPIVLVGFSSKDKTSRWHPPSSSILQDPVVSYYTGINQADIAVVLQPKPGRDILFLPRKNSKQEFWEGFYFGLGNPTEETHIKKATGFDELKAIDDLTNYLGDVVLSKKKALGLFWNATQKGRVFADHHASVYRRFSALAGRKGLESRKVLFNIASKVWEQRPILDDVDIKNSKTATAITTEAFGLVLRRHAQRRFANETQIAGFLEGHLKSKSPFGLAFPTIVAGGENARTLHYRKNDSPIDPKGLVLVDFGVRYQHMHADISRTFPASGVFSPLQKTLYGIVLGAQSKVEAAAKAGVTIKALNELCWGFINKQLEKKVVLEGRGKVELDYSKAPHGVSHLIGVEVHEGDPTGAYKKTPMKEGWLISNEPGIYGEFEMVFDGERHKEAIGIRVEDNLLIQRNGCENLTKRCPKSIAAVESLLNPSN